MLAEQRAVGPEEQGRAVERAAVALDDADDEVDAVRLRRSRRARRWPGRARRWRSRSSGGTLAPFGRARARRGRRSRAPWDSRRRTPRGRRPAVAPRRAASAVRSSSLSSVRRRRRRPGRPARRRRGTKPCGRCQSTKIQAPFSLVGQDRATRISVGSMSLSAGTRLGPYEIFRNRCRRNGRSVSVSRYETWARRRSESSVAERRQRSGSPRPVQPRGAGAGLAQSSEHRADLRTGRLGRRL